MDDDAVIRKINLIQVLAPTCVLGRRGVSMHLQKTSAMKLPSSQVLQEDADADGVTVPKLPDSAACDWSESQIRQHFADVRRGSEALITQRASCEVCTAMSEL